MNRTESVYCLSSQIVTGQLVPWKNFCLSDKKSGLIVFADTLSVADIYSLIKADPAAVIVKKGSFASHAAGLLNSAAIQFCIAPGLPVVSEPSFAQINGQAETLILSDKPFSNSVQPVPKSGISTAQNISLRVDGKSAAELTAGLKAGASGVGILRTEWLGWDQFHPPGMLDHLNHYRDCAAAVHPHKLHIRLFDLGGDKIPKWAACAKPDLQSPLGLRGIRAISVLRQAFDQQITAICKLARETDIGVVLPMVTHPQEVTEFRQYVNTIDHLAALHIEWGAMVETPSCALEITDLLKTVDYIRIGPGDLSQFTLAMDRDIIPPADYSGDGFSSGLIKLIKIVVSACRKSDKLATLCLDLEPRINLLHQLLSTGIDTFCLSPHNVAVARGLLGPGIRN